MILLSMTPPARANRTLNLGVASLCIPIAALNAVGESWIYFYSLGVELEVLILAFILRCAWTSPRTSFASTSSLAAPSAPQLQMDRHHMAFMPNHRPDHPRRATGGVCLLCLRFGKRIE